MKWKEEVEAEIRGKAQKKRYMQPLEASWRDFLQYRNWTPTDVDELPDDWLYAEWGRYQLKVTYGMEI